jgi:hypothetical protein
LWASKTRMNGAADTGQMMHGRLCAGFWTWTRLHFGKVFSVREISHE